VGHGTFWRKGQPISDSRKGHTSGSSEDRCFFSKRKLSKGSNLEKAPSRSNGHLIVRRIHFLTTSMASTP
jgi:hypothetical protein